MMTMMNSGHNVEDQIKQFIALAQKYRPNDVCEYDGYSQAKKYYDVHVCFFSFRVNVETGEMRACGRARPYAGRPNIADYLHEDEWKQGVIANNSVGVPTKKCGICGRQALGTTKVGVRCQHCMRVDTQHVNLVRRLGGVPMLNGRPLMGGLHD